MDAVCAAVYEVVDLMEVASDGGIARMGPNSFLQLRVELAAVSATWSWFKGGVLSEICCLDRTLGGIELSSLV